MDARDVHLPDPALAGSRSALNTCLAPKLRVGSGNGARKESSRRHDRKKAHPDSHVGIVCNSRGPGWQTDASFKRHACPVQSPYGQIERRNANQLVIERRRAEPAQQPIKSKYKGTVERAEHNFPKVLR